jgi:tetratricopeptide (TPR) repeat protein
MLCLAVMAAGVSATAGQYSGSPVKKDKLLNVLRSHQLQTREIVAAINTAGVDFQVTPDVEQELVSAGARPQVIAAAKANYRAPAVAVKQPVKGGAPTKGPKKTGQPLTKDAIVTLLENGVADAQVRTNVEARGVSFKATTADKTEIRNAGGSVALVNLIAQSYTNPNENAAANNDTPTTGGGGSNRYNELIDLAIQQYDVQKNSAAAIETLKQAIGVDPIQPRAYQQVGYAYLYGQKNFEQAEIFMKQAIDHGGSAVFRVFHDHGALMTDTCQGSLFVAKDTVRFESDDNKHTFETTDVLIKKVKMASAFFKVFNMRAGAFKIELKTGENDSKNYNFAPLTNDAKESKMIIKLIGKDS